MQKFIWNNNLQKRPFSRTQFQKKKFSWSIIRKRVSRAKQVIQNNNSCIPRSIMISIGEKPKLAWSSYVPLVQSSAALLKIPPGPALYLGDQRAPMCQIHRIQPFWKKDFFHLASKISLQVTWTQRHKAGQRPAQEECASRKTLKSEVFLFNFKWTWALQCYSNFGWPCECVKVWLTSWKVGIELVTSVKG